jgi:hypothetical protein
MMLRDYYNLILIGLVLLGFGSLLGLLFVIEHLTGLALIPFRGVHEGSEAIE